MYLNFYSNMHPLYIANSCSKCFDQCLSFCLFTLIYYQWRHWPVAVMPFELLLCVYTLADSCVVHFSPSTTPLPIVDIAKLLCLFAFSFIQLPPSWIEVLHSDSSRLQFFIVYLIIFVDCCVIFLFLALTPNVHCW